MFKNMKLSMKIAIGFGALMLIIVLIGLMGTIYMNNAEDTSQDMADNRMPSLAIANEIQRNTLFMMYNVRGFFYTDDPAFLDRAAPYTTSLNEAFQRGDQHTQKYPNAGFQEKVKSADNKTQQYTATVKKLQDTTNEILQARDTMGQAAVDYLNQIDAFLKEQQDQFAMEVEQSLAAGQTPEQLQAAQKTLNERLLKVQLCNDLRTQGNTMRRLCWQGFATRNVEHFEAGAQEAQKIYKTLEQLREMSTIQKHLDLIALCRQKAEEYEKGFEKVKNGWAARDVFAKDLVAVGTDVANVADETSQDTMKTTTTQATQASSALNVASKTMVGGLITGVVLGFILSILITRSITGPIQRIISGLSEGATQVAAASSQVSMASQSLAEGTTEQAAGLEETSSSLQEMSGVTQQNSDNATEANSLAKSAQDTAQQGNLAMQRMDTAINEIRQSADETAKIIKVIDEIAFQTNLLALNAAVEAARAGEAGKGFAVVAEEVRNLAMRSAEAAKNTASMIEQSVKNAQNGVQIAQEVGQKLTDIVDATNKVNNLVAEIAHSSKEQSEGITQINTAVSQIDQVTQQNAANAEESASASEELNAQAEQMNSIVNELVLMVSGRGANLLSTNTVKPKTPKPLTKTDRVFHQIAKTKPAKPAKTSEATPVILGDEDFDDFNK